jgi:hypothetical protein
MTAVLRYLAALVCLNCGAPLTGSGHTCAKRSAPDPIDFTAAVR